MFANPPIGALTEIADGAPGLAWVAGHKGTPQYFNRNWCDFTGFRSSASEKEAGAWMSAMHPDDKPACQECWGASLVSGIGAERECRIWNAPSKSFRWVLMRWLALPLGEALGCGWLGIAVDVHDFKVAKEKLTTEVSGRLADTQRALAEKETLLREVHHRANNTLQVVNGLLNLQIAAMTDEAAMRALRDSERRVRALAIIQQNLHAGTRMGSINFVHYVEQMSMELREVYHPDCVVKVQAMQPVVLDADRAVACGLILNELITNALKHAYSGARKGEIEVRFQQFQQSEGPSQRVEVRDEGVGLPENFSLDNVSSPGLTLVKSLVEQLDGELSVKVSGGTAFVLAFPDGSDDSPKSV